jgi:hypothetical protein
MMDPYIQVHWGSASLWSLAVCHAERLGLECVPRYHVVALNIAYPSLLPSCHAYTSDWHGETHQRI